MKRRIIVLLSGVLLLSNLAMAQSWKKAGIIIGGVSVTLAGVLSTSINSSKNAEVGESNSETNSKANIEQVEDDFYAYLVDYQAALDSGSDISLNDIQQPYVKELILAILENAELVAQIEKEMEGESLLEKINNSILLNFQAK